MIEGFFPPIPTPFERGEFSPQRLAENLDRWNGLPIDGYVVLGSNGEAPLIDDHERGAVIRAAWEAIPYERKLIVGAGRESTRATIRAVNEAFDLGADAALVGVPGYYKPAMTDPVLLDHYRRVADASPGPILLYSVPFFTGLPMSTSLAADLFKHERVAGIKDSSGDLASLKGLMDASRSAGGRHAVLVGNASILADGLALGASGAVLAVGCVAPRRCADIAALARADRAGEARLLNDGLTPLSQAVTRHHGIGGLKAALDLLDYFGGDPRPPLPPAGPEARARVAAALRELGLLT